MFRSSVFYILSAYIAVSSVTGCGFTEEKVRVNSEVNFEYSMKVDGRQAIPEASPENLKLTIGRNVFPMEFEKSLIGLAVGDVKVIALEPAQAFGEIDRSLFSRIAAGSLPSDVAVKEGAIFRTGSGDRTVRIAKVLDDGTVVVDRNHPFAGKKITYKVKILEIK